MNKSPRPVVDFITYMRVIKNRTAQTTAKYEHDLCMFLRHVAATREGLKAGIMTFRESILILLKRLRQTTYCHFYIIKKVMIIMNLMQLREGFRL